MLYECDPNKNTECTKETCIHNLLAEYPQCRLTTKEEYAKDGGKRYVVIDGKMFEMGVHRNLPKR